MIYIIYETLIMLKNYQNYCKDSIFKLFFKDYNSLLFFKIKDQKFKQVLKIDN